MASLHPDFQLYTHLMKLIIYELRSKLVSETPIHRHSLFTSHLLVERLLGSTEANASRYGVHNGGAWTQASYNAFRASGGTLDHTNGDPVGGTPSLLVTSNIAYVQPEQLKSVEIGYKGLINSALLIDLNGYFTSYKNFIGGEIVAVKMPTSQKGVAVDPGSLIFTLC